MYTFLHFIFPNASVQQCPSPPPWANPWALAFFKKVGKFPRVGTHKLSKCPGVGTKNEGKHPAPRIVAFQYLCSFFY